MTRLLDNTLLTDLRKATEHQMGFVVPPLRSSDIEGELAKSSWIASQIRFPILIDGKIRYGMMADGTFLISIPIRDNKGDPAWICLENIRDSNFAWGINLKTHPSWYNEGFVSAKGH